MKNSISLRNQYDELLSPSQPLAVDTVEAQVVKSQSETLTYNGKAAAGAVTINSTSMKAIVSNEGDQVASFWGLDQNKVYTALADGSPNKGSNWVTSLTETAGSAAVVVYDPDKNLENMFESLTGTVKRFVLKATDKDGGTLYGWIFGVAASSNVYTIDVVDNRLTETQDWVGSLAGFDNTAIEKIEIFRYSSSLAFGTGTTLTEEVVCPREYSKKWENPIVFAEALENGQYFVDYMRGRVIGKRADATASETIAYNIWQSLAGGSGGVASDVNINEVAGTSTVEGGVSGLLGVGGNAASDAADAGNPVKTGGVYNASEPSLDDGDRGDTQVDINGYTKVRGKNFDSTTQSDRTSEINPLSSHYVGETLADVTDGTDGTYYYYVDMAGYREATGQLELSGGSGTVTVTLEATVQDDGTPAASCAYQSVTNDLFGVVSATSSDMWSIDNPTAFKYFRYKVVASTGGVNDADWVIYHKKMF